MTSWESSDIFCAKIKIYFQPQYPPKCGTFAKRILKDRRSQHRDQQTCAGILQGIPHFDSQKLLCSPKILLEKDLLSVLIFASTKSGQLSKGIAAEKLPKIIHNRSFTGRKKMFCSALKAGSQKFLSRRHPFPVELILTTSDLSLITMCHQIQKIMYTVSAEQPSRIYRSDYFINEKISAGLRR